MFDKVGIPTVAVVENMVGVASNAVVADAEAFAAKHSLRHVRASPRAVAVAVAHQRDLGRVASWKATTM